jgi:hypothetical protein
LLQKAIQRSRKFFLYKLFENADGIDAREARVRERM